MKRFITAAFLCVACALIVASCKQETAPVDSDVVDVEGVTPTAVDTSPDTTVTVD